RTGVDWRAVCAAGSTRDVETREDPAKRRIGVDALDLRFRFEDNAVPKRRRHERLHVIRRDEIASVKRGSGFRGVQQMDPGAGTRAELEVAGPARLFDDADDVTDDGILDGHLLDPVARRAEIARSLRARGSPRPRAPRWRKPDRAGCERSSSRSRRCSSRRYRSA